jgi:hypothetical protein
MAVHHMATVVTLLNQHLTVVVVHHMVTVATLLNQYLPVTVVAMAVHHMATVVTLLNQHLTVTVVVMVVHHMVIVVTMVHLMQLNKLAHPMVSNQQANMPPIIQKNLIYQNAALSQQKIRVH